MHLLARLYRRVERAANQSAVFWVLVWLLFGLAAAFVLTVWPRE